MKKTIIFLAILFIPSFAFAGGIFSGVMGSGFGTNVSYRADTYAYEARVEADGGTIISMADVDAAYQFLADNSITTCQLWVGAQFGVKKDGSNNVTKLYDLSDNDTDFASGTSPVWTANQQNGKAGIVFTAASSQYLINNIDNWRSGDNIGGIYTVAKSTGAVTTYILASSSDAYDYNYIHNYWTGDYYGIQFNRVDTSPPPSISNAVTGTTTDVSSTTAISAILSSGSAWTLWVNSVSQTATVAAGSNSGNWFNDSNTETNSRSHVTIGCQKRTTSYGFYGGTIFDLIYLSTTDNRTDIQTFLNTKWAVYE